MYCSNCGNKINEDEKFCGQCGNEMLKNNFNSNNSRIRKALKSNAREQITGTMIGGNTLFTLSSIIITYFVAIFLFIIAIFLDSEFIALIFSIITFLIGFSFSFLGNYAITNSSLDILRKKDVSFSSFMSRPFINFEDFIKAFLINISFTGSYYGLIVLFEHIPFLGTLLILLLLIIYIYFYPIVDIVLYIYSDQKTKEKGMKNVLRSAADIIKGRRIEYYAMLFSFIGWLLLAILTFGILLIWILPYIRMSMTNMYLNWTEKLDIHESENGISNEGIIGISVGVYILIIIIIITNTIINELSNEKTNNEYIPFEYNQIDRSKGHTL